MEKREIWASGRKGGIACVTAFVYDSGDIIATSEPEHITEHQMHEALASEFPGVEFSVSRDRGDGLFMESKREEDGDGMA